MKPERHVIEGVAFECLGRWRYVVVYRYPGARRAHIAPWEGFTSFDTITAARRAFTVTHERHPGAWVYLADLRTETFVAEQAPANIHVAGTTDNRRAEA